MLWKIIPWLAYILGFVLIDHSGDGGTTMANIGLFLLFAGMVMHFRFWGKVIFLIFAFIGGALVGFKLTRN